MLKFPPSRQKPVVLKTVPFPFPGGGLNRLVSPLAVPPNEAYFLNNYTLFTSGLAPRYGTTYKITSDFVSDVKRLYNYAPVSGAASLWATTANGVFDCSTTGAAPAVSIALTNGVTQGAILSTGAANYLILVNGTDSMVQYNGAAWAATATVGGGAINTNTFSYVEVYRQRVYFAVKNTTDIVYLNANSPTGGGTTYSLAAIFRKGGYITALGTWTVDGGTGPDDNLVICTSEGELAVFTGNDPSTWTYKGTYYIAPPLGNRPFLKYGGDLLFLCANGVYPLSRALLVATIDRSSAITNKINPLITEDYGSASSGVWDMLYEPKTPSLMVNTPSGVIYLMNTQTGAWFSYDSSAWDAACLALFNGSVHFGSGKRVIFFDNTVSTDVGGTAIACTYWTGYLRLAGSAATKVHAIQPILNEPSIGGGAGTVTEVGTIGVANVAFAGTITTTPLYSGLVPSRTSSRWYDVPDTYSIVKQIRMQYTYSDGGEYYGANISFSVTGKNYVNAGKSESIGT